MLASRRAEIDRIAADVCKALELEQIPFPVEEAVTRLGGHIVTLTGTDPEAYVRKAGDAFVIGLASQSDNRRRFSMAHELGHLFLHMGYIVDPKRWSEIDEYRDAPKYRYGFSDEEYEAHEFAAALLMPEVDFRSEVARVSRSGQAPLAPLAERFQVSTKAARLRGQWLGVFEWAT